MRGDCCISSLRRALKLGQISEVHSAIGGRSIRKCDVSSVAIFNTDHAPGHHSRKTRSQHSLLRDGFISS